MGTLARIRYKGSGRKAGEVMYATFGQKCVFSGITPDTTSTINAAEEIVMAIAGVTVNIREFYDIQTRRGYNGFFETHERLYHFDHLKFKKWHNNGMADIDWREEPCPLEIYRIFKPLIGELPPLGPWENVAAERGNAEAVSGKFYIIKAEEAVALRFLPHTFRGVSCPSYARDMVSEAMKNPARNRYEYTIVDLAGHDNLFNQFGKRFSVWRRNK